MEMNLFPNEVLSFMGKSEEEQGKMIERTANKQVTRTLLFTMDDTEITN